MAHGTFDDDVPPMVNTQLQAWMNAASINVNSPIPYSIGAWRSRFDTNICEPCYIFGYPEFAGGNIKNAVSH
tara:strand:+ start:7785 stop:8000 length:216 start_codon:yes stop_codon:yes gene_type:complete